MIFSVCLSQSKHSAFATYHINSDTFGSKYSGQIQAHWTADLLEKSAQQQIQEIGIVKTYHKAPFDAA